MAVKPIIAVVGRPNVGKSTFFNKMVGARVSIVQDSPGVTRDRVYADASWQNYEFTLVDTGGIDPYSDDPLLRQMRRQAEIIAFCASVTISFPSPRQPVLKQKTNRLRAYTHTLVADSPQTGIV